MDQYKANTSLHGIPLAFINRHYDHGTSLRSVILESPTDILGEGSYGTVVAAGEYAIKEFRVHNRSNDYDIDYPIDTETLREISLIQALKHPNIIDIISIITAWDSDLDTYTQSIVMPRADGNLRDYIMNSEGYEEYSILSYDVKKSITQQLAKAIAYIHSRHIIHRDIKPMNVLIFEDDNGNIVAKLADFGLAVAIGCKPTIPIESLHSISYSAPELILDHIENRTTDLAFSADIWAFGCVVYEMWINSSLPIFYLSHNLKVDKHLYRSYVDKAESPKTLDYLLTATNDWRLGNAIMRLLHIDPKQRPSAYDFLNQHFGISEYQELECLDLLSTRSAQPAKPNNRPAISVTWLAKMYKHLTDNTYNPNIYFHAIWIYDAYVAIVKETETPDIIFTAAILISSTYYGEDLWLDLRNVELETTRDTAIDILKTLNYNIYQTTTYMYLRGKFHSRHLRTLSKDYLAIISASNIRFDINPLVLANIAHKLAEIDYSGQLEKYFKGEVTSIATKYKDIVQVASQKFVNVYPELSVGKSKE